MSEFLYRRLEIRQVALDPTHSAETKQRRPWILFQFEAQVEGSDEKQTTPLDSNINSDTIMNMTKVEELVAKMHRNPRSIRFRELCRICDFYFGKARQSSSSHRIYPTPWQGDPRINIQNDHGKAKAYQVKQILRAIERLEQSHAAEE